MRLYSDTALGFLDTLTPDEISCHDEEISRAEAEAVRKSRDAAFAGCGVGEGNTQCTFCSYEAETQAQKEALSAVWNFCRTVASGGCSALVLYGGPGSGKTHLAAACLNMLMHKVRRTIYGIDEYFSGRYVSSQTMAAAYMATRSYSCRKTYEDVTEEFSAPDILVIDEVGRDPLSSQAESSGLFSVIDRRKSKGKSTVLVTNYSWREFCSALGAAAMSRILHSAVCVDMSGIPDWRLSHRQSGNI